MSPALMEREKEREELELMPRFIVDIDRLFDDFWARPWSRRVMKEFTWSPELEVFEKNGRFNVRADLPGLTRDDVKVNVVEGMLTLEGERKKEQETRREGYYRSERSYGTFYRAIALPKGSKVDQIEATFKNGVLEISLPRVPEQASKAVEVKVG